MATVISESPNITVYVNGFEVYSGSASRAPNQSFMKNPDRVIDLRFGFIRIQDFYNQILNNNTTLQGGKAK